MNAPSRALLATMVTVASAGAAVALAALVLLIGPRAGSDAALLIPGIVVVAALAVAGVLLQRRSVHESADHLGSPGTAATVPAGFSRARVIAEMGHDLRQPLHALGLFLDALERRVTPGEGEKVLLQAREAASALARSFNALIDLVRVEADAVLPELERFAVDDFLIRLHEDSAEPATAAGVDLKLVHAHAEVVGDARLTAYVARVLLANATDLGQGRLLIGARRRANTLWLELHCAGKDKLARKWDVLRDPSSDPPQAFKPAELDLYVARRLADLIGVELRVTPKGDRGLVLGIALPLAGDETSLPLRGRSVLLVGDDVVGCREPGAALARAGAVVHVASNPRQAEYAQRIGKVDLLVTQLALGNAGIRERFAPAAPVLPNRTALERLVAAASAAVAQS